MKKDTQKMQELVNHPSHYTNNNGIECIDFIFSIVNQYSGIIAGDLQNVCKYVWRAHKKAGKIDVKKAQWYYKHAETIWLTLDEKTHWILKSLTKNTIIPTPNAGKTKRAGIKEIIKGMDKEEEKIVLDVIEGINNFYDTEKREKGTKALERWTKNFDTFK